MNWPIGEQYLAGCIINRSLLSPPGFMAPSKVYPGRSRQRGRGEGEGRRERERGRVVGGPMSPLGKGEGLEKGGNT